MSLIYEKVCHNCGKRFSTKSKQKRFCCQDCRTENDEMIKNKDINKGIYQITAALEEYNRKNGTMLSYGQFVGKIYIEKGRKKKK